MVENLKNSKIVTGYWMDSEGYPYHSTNANRKGRYLGSLIAICQNMGLPVVCYTHDKSLQELEKVKNDYNLINLTIKILELNDTKKHTKISSVRTSNNIEECDGRGTEILWAKFDVLEKEIEGVDKLYWFDVGLQHPGIFPWRFSKKYNKIEDHKQSINNWWSDYDVHNFKSIFDENLITNIDLLTNKKVLFLTSYAPQTTYSFRDLGIIDNILVTPYPIGGMFGGDTTILKTVINSFWKYADEILDKGQICTEEALMKLCFDDLNDENRINFTFNVHASEGHDYFHFSDWDGVTPKPLYMSVLDIKNYKF